MPRLVHQETVEERHTFWKAPAGVYDKPAPYEYVEKVHRSKFLLELIEKYINKESEIVELGCNIGRNLNYLFENGYHNLTGVDINKEALELMVEWYPELKCRVYCDSIENWVKTIPDGSYDLIFTMATLQHLHPRSMKILIELGRITIRYVVTIEREDFDYSSIWKEAKLKEIELIPRSNAFRGRYTARVLEK